MYIYIYSNYDRWFICSFFPAISYMVSPLAVGSGLMLANRHAVGYCDVCVSVPVPSTRGTHLTAYHEAKRNGRQKMICVRAS